MAVYNLKDDEVQTLIYLCLAKVSVTDAFKAAGVQTANKVTINLIRKVPGTVLTAINQKTGFRFITKFGEKGIINPGKLVPVAGGGVSGGADLIETQTIAMKAYRIFLLNDLEWHTQASAAPLGRLFSFRTRGRSSSQNRCNI